MLREWAPRPVSCEAPALRELAREACRMMCKRLCGSCGTCTDWCANFDADPGGDWCRIEDTSCSPDGKKNWGYCDTASEATPEGEPEQRPFCCVEAGIPVTSDDSFTGPQSTTTGCECKNDWVRDKRRVA